MPLPLEGPGFLFNPEKNPERRYGTVELVRAIVRAAAHVHQLLPGSKLVVGDLSLPDGGPLPGHATHRNGRDVDVCFYLLTASGNPFPAKPIPIEPDGTGVDYRDLSDGTDDIPVRLDAKRTWSFLHALLTDPDVSVNRIFVAEHIRKILLQQAKAEGANPDVQERFGHVTCQPSFPHDDHMHIRLFCSLDDIDAGCEDTPPIYPWHARYLASHDRTARLPRPRPSRAEVTSVAEAAKNAERKFGSLHPDVTAFLKRRETWVRKPSPGRPYCP